MFTKEPHITIKAFILVVLSLFLMMVDWQIGARNKLRDLLSVPLTSIEYLVSWPIQSVKHLDTIFKSHKKLLSENEALTEDQLFLKAKIQQLMAMESENEQLRALLHASNRVKGKVLAAHLLAIDADPFVRQVVVDRGMQNGLFVGQTVLDAFGVLGQVIEVNPLTSRVLLIDDPRSGVPVQVVRSGVRAIAVGDVAAGALRLANVPQTADIVQGDILITSGIGNNYPSGYPLGRVSSVVRSPSLQFTTIKVDPVAHLDRGAEVLLVWPDIVRLPT